MSAIIVGAGIGGLATAIAMQMRDIDVKIFEAVHELSPIGAGILIPPNAMTILDRYKLARQVQNAGISIDSLVILDSKGKKIFKTPAHYFNSGIKYHTVAIHRGVLQNILINTLAPEMLFTGKKCAQAISTHDKVNVLFEDDTSIDGDFLIGADGIHSKVRESVFPDSPLRYSGQTCWRGISTLTLPSDWATQYTEVWGNGLRFGFVPISASEVYWYATKVEEPGGLDIPSCAKQQLIRLYKKFFEPVGSIISQTEPPSIIRGDIHDLTPLNSWFKNSVVLIGDAAHASTPNLGQGGAQAIEDSWVLAERIENCKNIQQAFKSFQDLRYEKVQKIVKISRQIGTVTNLSTKITCRIRNTLLRSVPYFVAKKQSHMLYNAPY